MKNVTVALPEEIALWLRAQATGNGRSVSKWLAELLERTRRQDDDYEAAMECALAIQPEKLNEGGAPYPSRSTHYDRGVIDQSKSLKKSFLILLLLAGGGCTSVPLESADFQKETVLYLRETVKVSSYTLSPGYYALIGSRDNRHYFESSPKTAEFPSGLARGFVTKAILVDPHRAVMVKPGKLCVVTVFNAYGCRNVEFGSGKMADLKPFPN